MRGQGKRPMSEIAEYERRISFALERISRGVETLTSRPAAPEAVAQEGGEAVEAAPAPELAPEPAPEPAPEIPAVLARAADQQAAAAAQAEIARLTEALEAERTANAQLSERVRAIREKQETMVSAMEKRLAQTMKSYEAAQVEIGRLKRVNKDLSTVNAEFMDSGNSPAAHLINRAAMAELEALRAARASEAAEIEEVLGAIEPLLAARETGAEHA